MNSAAQSVLSAIAIGIGATLLMDAWNLSLKLISGVQSLNYCFLGRWLLHMPAGTFVHRSIAQSPQRPLECPVGWIAHYSIGIVFALVFVRLAPAGWLARPTILPALLFGIVTVGLPLFIMQPSLGFGIASSRAANPSKARLKSIATHTVFGVGLYVCALVVSRVVRYQ